MRNAARAFAVAALSSVAVVGFAAAFALASSADAGEVQTTDPPPTTTTEPPATTEPPTTGTEPTPPPPPRTVVIRPGVTVGGIDVEGLRPVEATARVREEFARPLVLVVASNRSVRLSPQELGAKANVEKAVSRARFARPGARVPLSVWVSRPRIERYVESLGRRYDRKPVDARQLLRGATVRVVPSKDGRRLQRLAGIRAIRYALKTHDRNPITLTYAVHRPEVSDRDLPPAVVIMRESKKLRLFDGGRLVRVFGVATGQAQFPTPIGAFEITTMQRNPWWYPPPSDWAAGEPPVPPGPGNPLGTRWMGISSPYVGIHGTPDAASIGYSASHGCVRMRIADAEWLFERVEVGTPVFIVRR